MDESSIHRESRPADAIQTGEGELDEHNATRPAMTTRPSIRRGGGFLHETATAAIAEDTQGEGEGEGARARSSGKPAEVEAAQAAEEDSGSSSDSSSSA